MQLKFDSVRQVLTAIEFYDVNRVALKYGRVVIFGGDVAATFMSVYNVSGVGMGICTKCGCGAVLMRVRRDVVIC